MSAYNPVIIIGAPRSGTNILRDVLCRLDGAATWPCDEINYVWRHGNVTYPSDEIPAEKATQRVQAYIRKQFDWVADRYQARTVVEKTCANSLRVPFVERVVPEAKYVFIYRDGIDVAGSARLRWTAKIDMKYLLEKVRFVPLLDLPYYGSRYLWSRLYKVFSREQRTAFWGPAPHDISRLLEKHPLNEICALQWQRCVNKTEQAFTNIPEERLIRIRYEEFVHQPAVVLPRILEKVGLEANERQVQAAVADVSSRSVGKGRQALSHDEIVRLEALIGRELEFYGYLKSPVRNVNEKVKPQMPRPLT